VTIVSPGRREDVYDAPERSRFEQVVGIEPGEDVAVARLNPL